MPGLRLLTVFAAAVFCSCFLYGTALGSYFDDRLLAASSRGDTAVVRDSISKGADINARDRLGNTSLILASDGGYQETALLLLNEGAAVNAMNVYGYTPLLSAVTNSHKYIAAMLFKAGADPEIKNKYGTSPSMYIKSLGFFTMEEYIGGSEPAMSALTDDRPERRGGAGGLHNAPWREKFNGLLSEGKAQEAADFLVKTAESGNNDARFLLGRLLVERNNVQEGVEWLKKAASAADENMLYEIGRLLSGGDAPYDKAFGAACLKRSMDNGNAAAGAEYAKLIFYDGGYAQAYPLFVSAAASGSPEAEYYQGYMLFAGKGVGADEEKGLALINKSASEGYGEAKIFLDRLGFEDMVMRIAASGVSDRTMLKGDILSSGAHIINGKAGCDTYGFSGVFGGVYGIRAAELCYPGDGTIKVAYYFGAALDADEAAYLKRISGNADFIFP